MRKYQVKGARRDTAEDVSVVVDAESEQDAAQKANASGILVHQITELEELKQNEITPSSNPALARYVNKQMSPMSMTTRINRWLANAAAELNVIIFFLICLAGVIIGGLLIKNGLANERDTTNVLLGFMVIISSFVCGIFICGVLAMLSSIHHDVKHISESTA
jgi:hypothetical protein